MTKTSIFSSPLDLISGKTVTQIFGKDVSGKVKRVIRDRYLIQSDRRALEIAYLGRPLSAPQRKATDAFYAKLSLEQQQAYSQKADIEFLLMWGSEPPNAKVAGQMKWVLRAEQMEKDYPGQVVREGKKAAPTAKVPGGAQDAVNQSKKALDPVTAFQQDLQKNAITRLSGNKTRLMTEEAKYKDTRATNQNWSHLRTLARQDEALNAHMTDATNTLWKYLKDQTNTKFAAAYAGLTVPADKGDMAARREQVMKYFSATVKDPAAQAQVSAMLERIERYEGAQSDLRIQYPALGAINIQQAAQMSGKAGENEVLLQQISGKFGEIRTSSDKLIGEIQKNPSAALQLDRVVGDTLGQDGVNNQKRKAGDPKSKAVLDWLDQQKRIDGSIKVGGTLLTGGLVLGAFLAPEFAVPLLRGAVVTGLATGIYELPQLMQQNLAAESAQLGGKKLTSIELEEARFNLAMGYTNIVMASWDAGVGTVVVKGITKLPGALRAAATLTKSQTQVFVASLARLDGNVTDAVVQTIAAGVRKADGLTTRVIVNADGTLSQAGPLNQAAQKMDTVAAKTAARAAKAAKPIQLTEQLSDEAAEKLLAKYPQWNEVKDYIGRPALVPSHGI